MNLARISVLALAAAALVPGAARAADVKPIRHLVYTFDVSITNDLSAESYSGTTDSSGGTADRGQIVLDVLAVRPDTGLVVRIAENARGSRSAEPAECVIYGNGQFECQSGKKINEEEYTLLRIAGRDFINPAQIDAKNHWRTATSSPVAHETDDYTVQANENDVLTIALSRQLRVKGAQGYTASTEGQLTYNQRMSVPVNDSEDTITRYDGAQEYDRVESKIDLHLVSDSMAQTASH